MYEQFYKLTGKPFQLNPDPSFFFASKGHSRAFAYLKYGVYQCEGFIVLTGDVGAGKTTMVRALLEDVDSRSIVAAQLISTQLDAGDVVHAIAAAFGLPIENRSKAEILAQFESFLLGLAQEGRRALLVVDEAQNLTPGAMEELRMLSNFQRGTRALLQSFLVGQPELREILRAPNMIQLRQRIIASYHLGPMDQHETRAYVLHRLQHVGWAGDPSIDESVYERLFAATRGVPRIINAVCDRLLLGACLGEKHAVGNAEFDDTIGEMRNEIRPDAQLAGAGERPPATHRAFASARQSALVDRLDRIEKTLGTALELLQQMAPATPDRRARFAGRAPRTG